MANTDNPFGMKPVRIKGGGPYTGAANPYYLPASYATAMFIGDPVVITGTSNTAVVTEPGAGKFYPGTLPEINKATAGSTNKITGVIVGFAPDPDGLGRTYNPASTERIAYVADDANLIFEIQCDGSIAPAQIGLNANLIYTNAGSTLTGLSGAELDGGTTTAPTTTANLQLMIERVVNREDNEASSAFTKVEVHINLHTAANGLAGV